MAIPAQTLSYAYDALSRVTRESGPLVNVDSAYDAASRRTRLTWPDGFYAQYDYDVTGAMTAIRENGAASGIGVLATYAYDNLGRRTQLTRGNGTTTTYAYDVATLLSGITNNLSGASFDQTYGFSYNPAGQIVSRTASNSVYDWPAPAADTVPYVPNGRNQYTSIGGAAQSYDARGNLAFDGANAYGYDYDYDIFSRLITGPGGGALSYDPGGRLYQAGSTALPARRFLYDGASIIGEYDTSNARVARYVPGAALDEGAVSYTAAGVRSWPLTDQLGSVIALTNDSGVGTARNLYDPYGQPGVANTGRFQYTGQMWLGEVGLYSYRARAYNPRLGRFMQTDPILYAGGPNLYAYVGNDPVNWTDPWGLQNEVEGVDVVGIQVPISIGRGQGNMGTRANTALEYRHPRNHDPSEIVAAEENEIVVTARCPTSTCAQQVRWNQWRLANPDLATDLFFEGAGFIVREAAIEAATGGLGLLRWVGKCGCFEEGTLVATPDGLRPIEEIAVGDEVLAWNPETDETTTQRVTELIRPDPKILWRLEVRNADGATETFNATDDHPWFIEGAGWVETQNLVAGQRIETADDRGLVILDIVRTERIEQTYNIEVDGPHTYLVGEDGAIVHNACGAYVIFFRSGRVYVGKGGPARAAQSARREAAANSDAVASVRTFQSRSEAGAFRLENRLMEYFGGPGSPQTYNRITSPGANLPPGT